MSFVLASIQLREDCQLKKIKAWLSLHSNPKLGCVCVCVCVGGGGGGLSSKALPTVT